MSRTDTRFYSQFCSFAWGLIANGNNTQQRYTTWNSQNATKVTNIELCIKKVIVNVRLIVLDCSLGRSSRQSFRDCIELKAGGATHQSLSGGQPNVFRMSPQGRAWRSSCRTFLSAGVNDCAQPITDIVVFGKVVPRWRASVDTAVSPMSSRPLVGHRPPTSSSRSNDFIGRRRGLEGALPPARSSSSYHRPKTADKHLHCVSKKFPPLNSL